MSAELRLWFTGQERPELQRIYFRSDLLKGPRSAVRGGVPGAYREFSTFTWSASVQALCLLILRAQSLQKEEGPHLSGHHGSPAVSLDYALTKQPQWLLDLFGSDQNGNAYARRFIRRSNSHRKRSGPVELALRAPFRVEVYLNDRLITESTAITRIAEGIEAGWATYGNRRRAGAKPSSSYVNSSPADRLKRHYVEELYTGLRHRNIFGRETLVNAVNGLYANPSFMRVLGTKRPVIHAVEEQLAPAHYLGLSDESWLRSQLCGDQPIRVAIPPSAIGAHAVFRYLVTKKGYNIAIDPYFVHGLEISKRILNRDPSVSHDLCVVPHAPAASLLNRSKHHDYRPLMLLPSCSHKIVAPRTSATSVQEVQPIASGQYLFLSEDPSIPLFHFEGMCRAKFLTGRGIMKSHSEPFETFSQLRCGDRDLRAILFFPYHVMNHVFNDCVYLDDSPKLENHSEMLLFARTDLAAETEKVRALAVAIRNSWLRLLEDERAVTDAVNELIYDESYLQQLSRVAGFRAQDYLHEAT